MQISGEANDLDLYSDALFLCGIPLTDTTTYTLANFVRNANFGLDKVNALAMKADGKWQFNDNNNTTELLDVTTALVAETQKYAIAITWLKIGRVRAKNSAGDFVTLKPVDRSQLSDSQLNATSGDPKYYDKAGNYVYLYPKPSYASAGGLEVQQQMGSTYFTVTATTTVPGFDSRFHRLISFYGALDYLAVNEMTNRMSIVQGKLNQMEAEFVDAIRSRNESDQPQLKTAREDYGQIGL